MKTGIAFALLNFAATAAHAHSYRVGNLEILHPAITVPQSSSDCTCAHVTIVNHGSKTEYFLGADIEIASNTKLLRIASHDHDFSPLSEVAKAPGATLDLHRHEWCLFLSDISKSLEADMGEYPAHLMFRNAGTINIEFMVDAPHH
jgi:periplasmic copper chaperone A